MMDWVVIVCIIVFYVCEIIVDCEFEVWVFFDVIGFMNWGMVFMMKCDLGIVVIVIIGFFF